MVMEVSRWWAEELAKRGFWIGHAVDIRQKPHRHRWCVATSEREAEQKAIELERDLGSLYVPVAQ